MAYDHQAEFQRLMEDSSRQQDAVRQKNAKAAQRSEDGGEPSASRGGGKSGGGKSGGGKTAPKEKSDTGLADAIKSGRDNFKPGAIPDGPTAPTGGGGKTEVSDAHRLIMKELTDRGVRPEVAAGAVGSLMGESGNRLNPAAYNPNDNGGPSGGIAQWHNERLTGLYDFAGTKDINKIPLETQVKYLGHELDTSYSKVLDGLKQGRTVADGVNIWTRSYEVPAHVDEQVALRMKHGESLWNSYSNQPSQSAQAAPAEAAPGQLRSNIAVSGHNYEFGSGGAGRGAIPEGHYPITPNEMGAWGQAHGAIGINHNAIWDKNLGDYRRGIEFHSATNDKLITQGCISVAGDKWPQFKQDVMQVLQDHGKAYLHVDKNGATVTPYPDTKTLYTDDRGQAKAAVVNSSGAATHTTAIDTSAMPANARSFMDDANVRGAPKEGQLVNIADLEAQDMARKGKGSVSTQEWKDAGAAENARRHPNQRDVPTPPSRPEFPADRRGWTDQGAAENKALHPEQPAVPLPPSERPRTFTDTKGWKDPGAAENAMRHPPQPDAPLPPERPADLLKGQKPEGPPMADYQRPQKQPDGPPMADYQRPQAAPEGPAVPPPAPPTPTPPTRPEGLGQQPQSQPDGPPAPVAAPAPAAQQAAPVWDPLYGYQTPPGQDAQAGMAQTQPQQDSSGDFGSWLGSLFDNPDNLNAAPQPADAPVADSGFDFGGGGDLFASLGSIFSGFESGGVVRSFARGGLVDKENGGRPDRVASAQPGVAIPAGYRNTDPGGGYTARRAISPGYALGGAVEEDPNDSLGAAPAPETEVASPEPVAPPVSQETALPAGGFDEAPIIGPSSVEAKEQAALEKYAAQKEIARQAHQPKNLRELLVSAATDVVHSVQSDYGIDRAVQRQQSNAVPTGEDKDPITAFFDMLSGAPQEAAPPEKVAALGHAVDPYSRLTEGMRTTAGMAAGVEYLLQKGDYKGAQEMARSVMFHQQLQAAKYGDQAVELLQQGKTEDAVQTLAKGQDQIPDGTTVKAKATPDGGAVVTQKDSDGKVVGHYRLNEADLMGVALGLKSGTAYWQGIVHLANGDKGVVNTPDAAYEQWQQRPETAITPPEDVNSPQYKAHQEAIRLYGPQPQLPHNFSQMTKEHQDQTRKEVAEQRQAWNTNYSQHMQGVRQQAGFGQQNTNREDNQQYRTQNREDNQTFRTGERVAGQEYRTGEREAGQEYRTGERTAKEQTTADRGLSSGKFDKPVSEALTTVLPNLDPADPNAAAVKGAAGGLLAANSGLSPVDAVKAGLAVLANKGEIRDDNGVRKLKLPSGRELVLPPGLMPSAPPPAKAPTPPANTGAGTWGSP